MSATHNTFRGCYDGYNLQYVKLRDIKGVRIRILLLTLLSRSDPQRMVEVLYVCRV